MNVDLSAISGPDYFIISMFIIMFDCPFFSMERKLHFNVAPSKLCDYPFKPPGRKSVCNIEDHSGEGKVLPKQLDCTRWRT